jgi:hypothetical protein
LAERSRSQKREKIREKCWLRLSKPKAGKDKREALAEALEAKSEQRKEISVG